MNHIRVLTGPMEGRTFELRGHTATVGRAPENDIRLDDPTVSRRHALISLKRDRYAIKDLGSHNGTWVNGRPLKPGTEVPLEEGIPVVIGSVQVSLGSPRTDDGLVNRYAISLFGKGGEINGTQLYKDRRITKRENLERIYEVSTTLMQSLDIDEICAKIMDSLFSSLKRIDSGAILLFNPETSELKVLISRSRYSRNSIKILYSRTIVSRVIREGKAVMLSDTGQAPEEDLSESMEVMKIQSVMCVPLIAKS
ncbi:MAG: FHA domain-containing protein, partial [Deltaproteobacteria bacterium]|nr:FHA domain-containing protein [Deltaproteobacteria bacterium]